MIVIASISIISIGVFFALRSLNFGVPTEEPPEEPIEELILADVDFWEGYIRPRIENVGEGNVSINKIVHINGTPVEEFLNVTKFPLRRWWKVTLYLPYPYTFGAIYTIEVRTSNNNTFTFMVESPEWDVEPRPVTEGWNLIAQYDSEDTGYQNVTFPNQNGTFRQVVLNEYVTYDLLNVLVRFSIPPDTPWSVPFIASDGRDWFGFGWHQGFPSARRIDWISVIIRARHVYFVPPADIWVKFAFSEGIVDWAITIEGNRTEGILELSVGNYMEYEYNFTGTYVGEMEGTARAEVVKADGNMYDVRVDYSPTDGSYAWTETDSYYLGMTFMSPLTFMEQAYLTTGPNILTKIGTVNVTCYSSRIGDHIYVQEKSKILMLRTIDGQTVVELTDTDIEWLVSA